MKEQEAFSRAMSTLHSDNASGLVKVESQGHLFSQEKSSSRKPSQHNADKFLKRTAAVSKDACLLKIASQLDAGGHESFGHAVHRWCG